jgi:Fe-S cluster assembly iron-binding protein IscA
VALRVAVAASGTSRVELEMKVKKAARHAATA